ncbi:Fe-S cluster assembly protein SufD [Merismopedia glauca CCAP 1448/3]|uniref:Fe-S cluster assembly protein SufD n=1 Tax=Merismopedia glauca CCAP 1448/3 TaxID=1296344 RepID=A0A2T1BX01_9CYAN|nr:Fe-S cluster assembly protein SufD [Merismopedia glauca CCAP 1448/3]
MDTKLSNTKEISYLSKLLQQRNRLNLQGVSQNVATGWESLRRQGEAVVQEMAIPTTKEEEWRFTDLSSLLEVDFQPSTVIPQDVTPHIFTETANSRLVFINGEYVPEVSSLTAIPSDIFVGNLRHTQIGEVTNYLGKQKGSEEVFTALNTASFTDGALLWIPSRREVTTPIHLLFISTAGSSPTITHPRCLVVVGTGSSLTLVEEYISIGAQNLTNSVNEMWLGANAQVNHTRVQRQGSSDYQIGKTAIAQAQDSRYTCNDITLGAKLSRHNLEIYQTGSGTETVINSLTAISETQLADTHSGIFLNHPHGTARQLHKCIVGDRARAVFNGKIFVPKPAQLTDAGQLNRNLLLSPKARVDTKPQLEITADNVKCAHGATVSQLEDDQIFYLQSRGLDATNARHLLIKGFALEIINQIPLASVQEMLTGIVNQQY